MILKSIKLNNIRSYNDAYIDFAEGSTLLIGDIGSGKTTILLAIEFALFGIVKGDVSGSSILRHGKKEGSVELNFECNNQDITILRKLKFSKDTVSQDAGRLTINNQSTDLSPIELKSKILEIFGYSEELLNKNTGLVYRYTVYTPQEDMKKILFESKEDRLDTLRKIFNIDKYKRIRENALIYAKELRNTKKNMENKISDLNTIQESLEKISVNKTKLLTDLEAENIALSLLKKLIDEKTIEMQSYEKNISELQLLKKDLEISTINLKNKKNVLDQSTKELSMVDYRIKEYNQKLSELEVLEDEKTITERLNDAEDKFSKIKNAREVITKRLEDKDRDLKNMTIDNVESLKYKLNTLSKMLEEKQSKEKLLLELSSDFEKNIIELNIINNNKVNATKIINQLKDLSSCPTCLQTVEFTHKVKITDKETATILGAERKITELQNKKTDIDNRIKILKTDLDALRKSEIEIGQIKTKLENIAKQHETKVLLEKEIEELKQKKEKLDGMDINKLLDIISKSRKMLNNIQSKKHIDESIAEKQARKLELHTAITAVTEELKILAEKHKEIENNILKFADVEKIYLEKKTALDATSKEHTNSTIKLSAITKDLEVANKEIQRLQEEIESKNKLKEKIVYASELNYWITEHIINLTSTIEKATMQNIHIEFNELFQKWFNMLIDDENIQVRIDEEFTPVIMQDGYDTEIASLSGGEKTSVALAYRLSLNKVINDLISNINTKDILILDEPTDGFSSEQLDKMRTVLQELELKQLIIVSHEAKMESYVNNIIRINKNEHISQIV